MFVSQNKIMFSVNYTHRKELSLVGSCLILLPTGLPWFWGNLGTYTYSYFYFKHNVETGSLYTWIMSLFLVCRTLAIPLSGTIIRKYGFKITVYFAVLIFNLGFMGSFWAIQYSVTFFIITFGGLCGIGAGFMYGPAIKESTRWKNQGLVMSLIQSCYYATAIFINEFVTFYLNPNNNMPNQNFGEYAVFTQKEMLDKVPSLFLVISVFFCCIQIFGMILITTCFSDSKIHTDVSTENASTCMESDLSPRQVVRTREFFLLWISKCLSVYPFLIISSYYKAIGQLYIGDDQFLSSIGSAIVISCTLLRLLFGGLIDTFGYKNNLIAACAVQAISSCFLTVTVKSSKLLYLINVLLFICPASNMMVIYIVALKKLFGKSYIISNIGMVSTVDVLILFISPPFLDYIFREGYWTLMIFTGCFAAFCNLLLSIFFP